jgi:integrase
LGRESKKRSANHVLTLLRAMFNKAIEWQIYTKENPTDGIKKYRFNSRERFLQSDEMPRFFAAVAEEPSDDVRDSVLICLLTGARKGNVMAMRWADVNLDRAEWRIPDTKNGSPVTLPLVPEAVEILQSRKPAKAAEFVFPGRGATGHVHDTKGGWKRIQDRDELNQLTQRICAAGLQFDWPVIKAKGPRDKSRKVETLNESLSRARGVAEKHEIDTTGARLADLRLHDLRRTLGSWQAASGASLVIIGKSLGHKNIASTEIYSRLNIDPVRHSVQTATRAIFAAGGLLPKAEVVPINKKVA